MPPSRPHSPRSPHGAARRPANASSILFKLKTLLDEHIDELARLITDRKRQDVGEAKAEIRRGIENVEVACGIPMMMQGYNLEDVTPRRR